MLHELSLHELSNALQQKKISSTELTQYFLKRINNFAHLNAFITVDEERALNDAKRADLLIQQGNIKPLTGIPIAHKDIFCTKDLLTTCGSKMLQDYISPYNATIVEKINNEGAVLIGKTNMDEFAMGSTNETSYFGAVKNPWNFEHVPGGSSGGSAAAVAAHLTPFATGSDTGGSIRQPSAFCALSGLKPTYGLVSRFGMIAYASSLDQAGPMTRSVEDLAISLQAMAGFDPKDSTSINKPLPNYLKSLNQKNAPLKIGVPKAFFNDFVDDSIKNAIEQSLKILENMNAQIVEVELKLLPLWVPCYFVIAYAEASSNLARFDGVEFGHRSKNAKNLNELVTMSRDEAFGLEVKRRILAGTYVLSSGYFDDYYLHAQKIRRMIQDELKTVLNEVDVLIGPTTPILPYKLGEKKFNPTQKSLGDTFTVCANLAGLPALSIPAGFNNGLPIGMQIIGAPLSEEKLLNIGHFYQQNTNWHKEIPPME